MPEHHSVLLQAKFDPFFFVGQSYTISIVASKKKENVQPQQTKI